MCRPGTTRPLMCICEEALSSQATCSSCSSGHTTAAATCSSSARTTVLCLARRSLYALLLVDPPAEQLRQCRVQPVLRAPGQLYSAAIIGLPNVRVQILFAPPPPLPPSPTPPPPSSLPPPPTYPILAKSLSAVKTSSHKVGLPSDPIFVYGLPAAAGVVAVVCIFLIGHHRSDGKQDGHGGGLFHLIHPLRLPFYFVAEVLNHCTSASRLFNVVTLLDAGVATTLGAISFLKSILLVYKLRMSEKPAAIDLRLPATMCLGAPLILSFTLVIGLLVHGIIRADRPLVSRKVLESHSGATAGLCLLAMMNMKLLPLIPWTDAEGRFLHALHQDFGGMPGRFSFDLFLLVMVLSTVPAFTLSVLYIILIETSPSASYLTVYYGLELGHTLLSKGIFRLSKLRHKISSTTQPVQALPSPAAVEDVDDPNMNQACVEVETSQDRGNRIVHNHARMFIEDERQHGRQPEFVRWIGELDPENVSLENFPDTEGLNPRIHQQCSNFRILWSEALALQHKAIPCEDVAEVLRLQAINRLLHFQLLGAQSMNNEDSLDHKAVDLEIITQPQDSAGSSSRSSGVPPALMRAREANSRTRFTQSLTRSVDASATGDKASLESKASMELITSQFNTTKQLQAEELRIIEREAQEQLREEEAQARQRLKTLEAELSKNRSVRNK